MEKIVEEKWKDKANLQQIFFLLIGAMVAVNATGLGYKGPIFGNWLADVIVVLAFIAALVYMRITDQSHQRALEDIRTMHEETMQRLLKDGSVIDWGTVVKTLMAEYKKMIQPSEVKETDRGNDREEGSFTWDPP